VTEPITALKARKYLFDYIRKAQAGDRFRISLRNYDAAALVSIADLERLEGKMRDEEQAPYTVGDEPDQRTQDMAELRYIVLTMAGGDPVKAAQMCAEMAARLLRQSETRE
jgi:prevent-host-death family protein